MLQKIIEKDIELLLFLNNLGTTNWDGFWLYVTNTATSIPIYLIALYFVFRYYGLKKTVITLLFIALLITISDQTANLFKYGFQRLRPCHNNEISNLIRLVKPTCGGLYSFFSAHASSSMAIAVFFASLLNKSHYYLSIFLLFWAILVGYSRIYIGVHFPADVLFGFLFGATVGWVLYKLLLVFFKRIEK